MPTKPARWNLVSLVIIITCGLFYLVIWNNAPLVTNDTGSYVEFARDLQDGKIDALQGRTPGYPLLLVIANSIEPTQRLFIIQLVLYLLSVFLLTVFLNDAGLPYPYTLLFLTFCLIPPSVGNTAYMLTETLCIFFIATGSFALFWGLKNNNRFTLAVSGIAFACSALVRPTYQLLFVMLTALLFLAFWVFRDARKKLAVAALSIFLASVIILGGYSLYNRQHFGYFGTTPMLGMNLSNRTVRVIERLPDQYKDVRELLIASRDQELVKRNSSHTGLTYLWGSTLTDLERITGLSGKDLSNYMLTLNLTLIREAPLEYVVEVSRAMATYWMPASTEVSNFDSSMLQFLWMLVHFVTVFAFFVILFITFGIAFILWRFPFEARDSLYRLIKPYRGWLLPFLISVSIIFYTMLISTMMDVGNPRFRTSTDLLMFLVIVVGAYVLNQLSSSPKSSE